jgi:hypothetical protein
MFLNEFKKLMSPKVKTIDPDDLPHGDEAEFWTAHISMQFSDSRDQMAADVDTIFERAKKRGYKWVTGTEAGQATLRGLLKAAANDAGYMFFVTRDVWICVKRDFIDRGYKTGYVHSIDAGASKTGKHTDKGIGWVAWHNDIFGEMTVGCIHMLTNGRIPGDPNFELNDAMIDDIQRWGRKAGKGNALVWLNGDVNNPTNKRDVFRGAPFTPADEELDKHLNTGYGPIDVQASYDKDGRVRALKWRSYPDRKIFMHSDHFFTEAQWGVRPVG